MSLLIRRLQEPQEGPQGLGRAGRGHLGLLLRTRSGGDGAAEPCALPSSCSAPWPCSGAADSPTGSNREKLTGPWAGVGEKLLRWVTAKLKAGGGCLGSREAGRDLPGSPERFPLEVGGTWSPSKTLATASGSRAQCGLGLAEKQERGLASGCCPQLCLPLFPPTESPVE